ncbi:ERMIN protein, partial [Chordeiles acutipennis]|nr:ERMIN protein [Chordeiles acutipennis]
MTEQVPVASTMPQCNGSVPPEKGPLQVIEVIKEMADAVGTVPYANAGTSPDAPLAKENPEENRNSLAEDVTRDSDGEKQCEEKREESDGTLQQGSADTQDTGTDRQESEEGNGKCCPELGTEAGSGGEAVGTLTTSTDDGRGEAAEEEDEAEEEEDTEEDEVQVIEIKKENGEVSHLQQHDSSKEASPATSPEKAGEQPSLGKKNDISRHSYSRYNTISYRRIRKGNTKQRIDEFESMMHL